MSGMNDDLMIKGRVYDIQGFSVQDGPGIRTTVFEKGCPLRCRWCHSPESQSYKKQLCWFELRCIGADKCGRCIEACPHGALSMGKGVYSSAKKCEMRYIEIDREKCRDCGSCAQECASNALFMSGDDRTVGEVLERVLKDRSYFARSGGGVTVSGGECLTQPEFTIAVLKALKAEKIHTAVDTTGYVKYEVLRQTLPYTDLYLYDLKHMDSKQHLEGTGVPNELILENALRLASDGGKLQIRIPLIPGYNMSEENIRAACEFCLRLKEKGQDAVQLVQLLPYHKFGAVKYDRLGIEYSMKDQEPPEEAELERLGELFRSNGFNCRIH